MIYPDIHIIHKERKKKQKRKKNYCYFLKSLPPAFGNIY
jgi:hypothetical protein